MCKPKIESRNRQLMKIMGTLFILDKLPVE